MNIKETIALGKSCVQDQELRCIGSRCMAWRFKVDYPKVEKEESSSLFGFGISLTPRGVYNYDYGRCGLVDK